MYIDTHADIHSHSQHTLTHTLAVCITYLKDMRIGGYLSAASLLVGGESVGDLFLHYTRSFSCSRTRGGELE